jgi:hypothetical protein
MVTYLGYIYILYNIGLLSRNSTGEKKEILEKPESRYEYQVPRQRLELCTSCIEVCSGKLFRAA